MNRPQVLQAVATPTSMTVVFSKELDAAKAEEPGNYLLEGDEGALAPAQTAVYDKVRSSVVLSGLDLPAGQKIKVTVRNVTDIGGSDISPAADSASTDAPIEKSDSASEKSQHTASSSKTSGSLPASDLPGSTPSAAYPNPALDALASGKSSRAGAGKSTASDGSSSSGDIKSKPASSRPAGGKSGDRTPPRVTQCTATASSARDVLDSHGNAIGARGNSASYADVTTWKYLLGLGIPTLVFALVAMFGFSRRDL